MKNFIYVLFALKIDIIYIKIHARMLNRGAEYLIHFDSDPSEFEHICLKAVTTAALGVPLFTHIRK